MADPADTPAPGALDTELLLKQARTYLAFCGQLRQFVERYQDSAPNQVDWGLALRQHFDQFRTAMGESAGEPGADPELARLWTLTLELWQRNAAALGIVAPDGEHADAWRAYHQAQSQYLDLLRQAAREALDLMEQRLSERATAGQLIDSLRELYNLWVDCNEKTYGRMLRSDQYSELSGRLFNTLLRCRPQGETVP